MKMVKSLLLGGAAALAAVTVAQAADLPVKAKPVQYVKICDLYGAGFYYMPGTDICIKIGGFVRYHAFWGPGNAPGFGAVFGAANGQNLNATTTAGQPSDFVNRVRGVVTIDTRQATDYGTLRTYWLMGYTHENNTAVNGTSGGNAAGLYATRAFIQWAGFTMGKATSFYDIYSIAAFGYTVLPGSDTGDGGQIVLAYTWQLGNGVSATLSLEDPRRIATANTSIAGSFPLGTAVITNFSGATRAPDVVGAIRIDQAWGSLQVAGALTDVQGGFFGTAIAGSGANGKPDSEVGFAVNVGGMIRADAISPGDLFGFQINYAEGATKYVNNTMPNAGAGMVQFSGSELTLGFLSDAVYGTLGGVNQGLELTKVFGFNVGYDHRWNPNWQTSIYGGYNQIEHTGTAKALICSNTGNGLTFNAGAVCDPDFSYWWVGTRTAWTPVRGWELGVDFIYYNLETAHSGTATLGATGLRPAGVYSFADNDNIFTVGFRAQRSFLP